MNPSDFHARFVNMTSVAGLMSWFGISVTYLRFYAGTKAQGMDRTKLPYYSRLQPYAAWYAAIACIVICFFSGWAVFLKGNWATDTFVTNYLPLMLFPVLYIGSYLWHREGFRKPEDMDFKTGLAEVEAASYDEPPPRNWVERVWAWLVRALHFSLTGTVSDSALTDVMVFTSRATTPLSFVVFSP